MMETTERITPTNLFLFQLCILWNFVLFVSVSKVKLVAHGDWKEPCLFARILLPLRPADVTNWRHEHIACGRVFCFLFSFVEHVFGRRVWCDFRFDTGLPVFLF